MRVIGHLSLPRSGTFHRAGFNPLLFAVQRQARHPGGYRPNIGRSRCGCDNPNGIAPQDVIPEAAWLYH